MNEEKNQRKRSTEERNEMQRNKIRTIFCRNVTVEGLAYPTETSSRKKGERAARRWEKRFSIFVAATLSAGQMFTCSDLIVNSIQLIYNYINHSYAKFGPMYWRISAYCTRHWCIAERRKRQTSVMSVTHQRIPTYHPHLHQVFLLKQQQQHDDGNFRCSDNISRDLFRAKKKKKRRKRMLSWMMIQTRVKKLKKE